MASAHIEIVGSVSRHNRQLRNFVDQLQTIVDEVAQIKATYDQMALGGDWAALATALSHANDITYPNVVSEADAETIYNLIGSVQGELNATFITQVLGRLG